MIFREYIRAISLGMNFESLSPIFPSIINIQAERYVAILVTSKIISPEISRIVGVGDVCDVARKIIIIIGLRIVYIRVIGRRKGKAPGIQPDEAWVSVAVPEAFNKVGGIFGEKLYFHVPVDGGIKRQLVHPISSYIP